MYFGLEPVYGAIYHAGITFMANSSSSNIYMYIYICMYFIDYGFHMVHLIRSPMHKINFESIFVCVLLIERYFRIINSTLLTFHAKI